MQSSPRGEPEELGPLGCLTDLQERHGLEVILYFDEDLARNSTLDRDVMDFRIVPVQTRPFMPLAVFLQMMAERDPGFARQEESPEVEVIETGTLDRYVGCACCTTQYVKGLLL
jgi:hypothetical protein